MLIIKNNSSVLAPAANDDFICEFHNEAGQVLIRVISNANIRPTQSLGVVERVSECIHVLKRGDLVIQNVVSSNLDVEDFELSIIDSDLSTPSDILESFYVNESSDITFKPLVLNKSGIEKLVWY